MQSFRGIAVSAFCLVGLLAGCRESIPTGVVVKTVPVNGIVAFQGQPLENYLVTFYPDGDRRPATGKTDSEGRFTLGTNEPGDGAVVGSHKLSVTYVGPETAAEPGREELSAMAPPPPKIKIPAKYGNAETSGLTRDVPESGLRDVKIDLQ